MRRGQAADREEGALALAGADELDGAVDQPARLGPLDRQPQRRTAKALRRVVPAARPRGAVLLDLEALGLGQLGAPVAAIEYDVEAEVRRIRAALVPVHLAEGTGLVAARAEERAQGDAVRRQRGREPGHAVGVRPAPGQQGLARRRAQAGGAVGVGEGGALRRQAIEGRRGRRGRGQAGARQVVAQDQQHVEELAARVRLIERARAVGDHVHAAVLRHQVARDVHPLEVVDARVPDDQEHLPIRAQVGRDVLGPLDRARPPVGVEQGRVLDAHQEHEVLARSEHGVEAPGQIARRAIGVHVLGGHQQEGRPQGGEHGRGRREGDHRAAELERDQAGARQQRRHREHRPHSDRGRRRSGRSGPAGRRRSRRPWRPTKTNASTRVGPTAPVALRTRRPR